MVKTVPHGTDPVDRRPNAAVLCFIRANTLQEPTATTYFGSWFYSFYFFWFWPKQVPGR